MITTKKSKNLTGRLASQLRMLPPLLVMWVTSCSPVVHDRYIGVREGHEDDINVLMFSLNRSTHSLNDTLRYLSPLIDPIDRAELIGKKNVAGLFTKYSSHPVYLEHRRFAGDSVLFQSSWLRISKSDSVMFEFEGVAQSDSVIGTLVSSMYLSQLAQIISETTKVGFWRVD